MNLTYWYGEHITNQFENIQSVGYTDNPKLFYEIRPGTKKVTLLYIACQCEDS